MHNQTYSRWKYVTLQEKILYDHGDSESFFFTIKTNRLTNFQIYSGTKHVEFRTRINLEISASLGFYCKEIGYDARSYERKISESCFPSHGLLKIKENPRSVHLDFPCRHYRKQTSGALLSFIASDHVFLPKFLPELLETRMCLWFMRDGAPTYFLLQFGEFLNNLFLEKWVGWDGKRAWPASSPHLSSFYYYIYGHLNFTVRVTEVNDIQDLQKRM